jgi:hypothetical protein
MADLTKILEGVQRTGQIASAANGLVGLTGALVASVVGAINELRKPDGGEKTPEQIAADLEAAVAKFGPAVDRFQAANDAYWELPAKAEGETEAFRQT